MPPILLELIAYFKNRLALLKYETIDDAIAILADIIVDFIIISLLVVAFVFFALALGLYIGGILKSIWAGFGIVTLLLIMSVFLVHLFKFPMQNSLIRIFIKKAFRNK